MRVIHVLRKPLSEGTVAANTLKHGTGGINIDASRVAHANLDDLEAHRKMVEAIKARGGSMDNSWKNSSDLSGANDVPTGGRWPGNLILQHLDGCRRTGTRPAEGYQINRFTDGAKHFGGAVGHAYEGATMEGGVETVWACVPGCRVRALDEQSGDRPSGGSPTAHDRQVGLYEDGLKQRIITPYNDTGGASRFFKQVGGSGETP